MTTTELTPGMEAVVMQVIYAEHLRQTGNQTAESEALELLEELCDALTLDELFIALRHVVVTMHQRMIKH